MKNKYLIILLFSILFLLVFISLFYFKNKANKDLVVIDNIIVVEENNETWDYIEEINETWDYIESNDNFIDIEKIEKSEFEIRKDIRRN